jgi:23S rRNA pseudouridine1911/1915/1917 synthase
MPPRTLLDWLIEHYPNAKRQTFKNMLTARRIRINARPALQLKQPLAEQDHVVVTGRQAVPNRLPDPSLSIVYEDADLLVVHKPAGLLTSTVEKEKRPTLLARVRQYVAEREPRARVGLIHRLDRDASGLLIFSKNDSAYRSLKAQFFHHTVRREYLAVVHGVPNPPAGTIESFLVERTDGTVRSTRQIGKGQRAVTGYETIKIERGLSLLRVTLETGRKHQIRAHLREKNLPIVGDQVYGRENDPAPRLMLAAIKLSIVHPRTGNELTWTTDVPAEFPVKP